MVVYVPRIKPTLLHRICCFCGRVITDDGQADVQRSPTRRNRIPSSKEIREI